MTARTRRPLSPAARHRDPAPLPGLLTVLLGLAAPAASLAQSTDPAVAEPPAGLLQGSSTGRSAALPGMPTPALVLAPHAVFGPQPVTVPGTAVVTSAPGVLPGSPAADVPAIPAANPGETVTFGPPVEDEPGPATLLLRTANHDSPTGEVPRTPVAAASQSVGAGFPVAPLPAQAAPSPGETFFYGPPDDGDGPSAGTLMKTAARTAGTGDSAEAPTAMAQQSTAGAGGSPADQPPAPAAPPGTTTTYGPSAASAPLPPAAVQEGPPVQERPIREAAVEQQPPRVAQAGTDPKSADIHAGPVTLTFGGFSELATIYRNHNGLADADTDFAGLPLPGSAAYYASEFRESARQSRFSLLAQGTPYNGAKAELYMETDFLSAGVTSNSRESNSYTLRLRHFYGRFTTDFGLDVTAGQTWSFLTVAKNVGEAPRDQVVPLTIDAQYVVGFNWTRNAQLRIVQKFADLFSVGLSIESPQAVTGGGANVTAGAPPYPGTTAPSPTGAASCGTTTTYYNCGDGAGLLNSITTYSSDTRPDIIAKLAFDPGWGHYEVYGVARYFTANVNHGGRTSSGGGVGGATILPIIPSLLSLQANGLVGKGIGRYGSGQLPDVAEQPNGEISPIREYQVMAGLILTPGTALTLYGYVGREKASNTYWAVPYTPTTGGEAIGYYGFGAPFGSTKQLTEVTVGEWWKFYRGVLGNAQFGLQVAYVQRDTFDTVRSVPGLSGNMFIGMASFRYYPYQN